MEIFEALPPDEDKELLVFEAFKLDKGFMKTIRQSVASSTLTFAEALKGFFDISPLSRTESQGFRSLGRLASQVPE